MTVNMKRKPSFFKVLIGDFSKQLRIPPAFIKNFKGTSVGNCILRSPTGKFWAVNVKQNVNGLYFGSGWLDFVKDHYLQVGDFLVFKYYGKSMFTVKIYDKSSCEKHTGPAKMNNDHPNFHSENRNQNQERVRTQECKPEIHKADTENKTITPMKGRCTGSGLKLFAQVDEQTIRSAIPFKSENFCFRSTWTESHKYYMNIPRQVVREKSLMTKRMVVLVDPTGRSWPVKLSIAGDGRLNLSDGWPDFWKGNNISIGDTLVFEIAQESAMQVHIFRGKEKAVPFQSRVFNPAHVKKIEVE